MMKTVTATFMREHIQQQTMTITFEVHKCASDATIAALATDIAHAAPSAEWRNTAVSREVNHGCVDISDAKEGAS